MESEVVTYVNSLFQKVNIEFQYGISTLKTAQDVLSAYEFKENLLQLMEENKTINLKGTPAYIINTRNLLNVKFSPTQLNV